MASPWTPFGSPVPPFEGVVDGGAHPWSQTQPVRQRSRGDVVRFQDVRHPTAPGDHEPHGVPAAVDGGPVGCRTLQQEPRPRQPLEVHPVDPGPEVDVVTEHRCQLGRIRVAADPGHQIGVVDDRTLFGVQAHPVRQPAGDDRSPQHVLHRLAEPEVDSQGQRGDHLGPSGGRSATRAAAGIHARHAATKPLDGGRAARPPRWPRATGLRGSRDEARAPCAAGLPARTIDLNGTQVRQREPEGATQ